jgi:hypothetical protein
MKIISHRGNQNGSNPEHENSPTYIYNALKAGFDCEIDLWVENDTLYLGHDKPKYEIDPDFLLKKGLWIHCKNIEASNYVANNKELNGFWHQSDVMSFTTHGYMWTFADKELTDKSVAVLPELVGRDDFGEAYGVCTDYPNQVINKSVKDSSRLVEHFYEPITGWFTFPRFYKDIVQSLPNGSTVVEVGVYEGKSLAYFMVEMLNAKKSFNVYAIDSFTFSDEQTNENIEVVLRRNLASVINIVNVIKGDSGGSAEQFEDESIDFLFLDADHVYSRVHSDIRAWLPKIKVGGIISGHDYCEAHEGVIEAVDEIFGFDMDRRYLDELVWMYVKK